MSGDQAEATVAIPVTAPVKWDAEHPNLYRLDASVTVGGQVVETLERNVGFRQIEVRGNRFYVNGRRSSSTASTGTTSIPSPGRAVTRELVEKDVQACSGPPTSTLSAPHTIRRARISSTPATAMACTSKTRSRRPLSRDTRRTTPISLRPTWSQFAEMIERDRSHPSIIMWSLANESYWGRNFQMQYDYVKQEDQSRPTIYSYQITMPEGSKSFELWSLHYARYGYDTADQTDNGSISGSGAHELPVIHDEYAHVVCYNIVEQMRDPAVREFWGESIKRFWDSIFETPGRTGWRHLGRHRRHHHHSQRLYPHWEWGLIDGWRREKPEHWLVKKAYSPIHIDDRPVGVPGSGQPLRIPIQNRFDHTNLNEVEIRWRVGGHQGTLNGPDLAPHASGTFDEDETHAEGSNRLPIDLCLPVRYVQTGNRVHGGLLAGTQGD